MTPQVAGLRIDRCVCRGRLFSELLPLARDGGWTLAILVSETGCGGQCGLCRPYLRRMLDSGETVFAEILTDT